MWDGLRCIRLKLPVFLPVGFADNTVAELTIKRRAFEIHTENVSIGKKPNAPT